MKAIALGSNGMVALVDDDAYELLSSRPWYPVRAHNVWYARAADLTPLHRAVMSIDGPCPDVVDHIDHDGLNCQRTNLRSATYAQNGWNARRALGASGHPGVSRNHKSWAVRFEHEGRTMYFGTYPDLETAKQIANREMWRLRGDFLPTNHPARLASLSA